MKGIPSSHQVEDFYESGWLALAGWLVGCLVGTFDGWFVASLFVCLVDCSAVW